MQAMNYASLVLSCAAILLACVVLAVGAGILLDYMERKAGKAKDGQK